MPTSFSWTLIPPTPTTPTPAPVAPSTTESHGAAAYARQLRDLLPPGVLWDLEQDSDLTALFAGLADEFARVDARAAALVEETDPRTATETITDWEHVLALPDEQVIEIPALLADRRVAVTQKLVGRVGQNTAYYFALFAACGWTLESITLFAASVLRAGFRVGDRVYGAEYAYTMQLNYSSNPGPKLTTADLHRVIRHVTHSHISLIFIEV